MSQYSNQSRFLVAMAGSLIVVGATWMVRHPSDGTRVAPSRRPSSNETSLRLETGKKIRLDEFSNAEPAGKVTGSFTVTIRGDDGSGNFLETLSVPASRVRLTGTIVADRLLRGHEYSWILPQGYRASDGVLNGKIPDLEVGTEHEVSLIVERDQVPLQPIVLHVFKLVNSEARGQVAQFDIPDPQDEKESIGQPTRVADPEQKYVQ